MRNKLYCLIHSFLFSGSEVSDMKLAEYLIANGVTIPVRCKDCKYYVWDEWDCCNVCVHLGKYVEQNFGCLGGERRTDD